MNLYEVDIDRLEKIKNHISSNLEKDLGIDVLASCFSLSRAKLQRQFSYYFNIPIHHFVKEQRMIRARQLLKEKAKSISQIAFLVGYKDRSSFSRAFTKFFKQNPIAI